MLKKGLNSYKKCKNARKREKVNLHIKRVKGAKGQSAFKKGKKALKVNLPRNSVKNS
jgi:hypothetical protein